MAHLLDILFPPRCLGCNTFGELLCQDCLSTIDLASNSIHLPGLGNLYLVSHKSALVNKMINRYKHKPFAKGLAQPLALLIISYLHNLEKKPPFILDKRYGIYIPPMPNKEMRSIGYSPSLEVANIIAGYYDIPITQEATAKTVLFDLSFHKRLLRKDIKYYLSLAVSPGGLEPPSFRSAT